MSTPDISELKRQLVSTCEALVRSGTLSMSGHGNVSLRVPGRDEILFTAGSGLHGVTPEGIVRLRLDGSLLEGELSPTGHEVIFMHTTIYEQKDDTGCVVHTHSPYATAFAVANKPIQCWSEAAARWGLDDGVPVAAYGPRGSQESLDNIRDVLTPKSKAVLLGNHGILAFGQTAQSTVGVCVALVETAQLALYASVIGQPQVIPPHMLSYAQERMQAFAATGAVSGGHAANH
ncbi:MAG: class II aldolase/adducin family protein [Chloroflexota bacterium]